MTPRIPAIFAISLLILLLVPGRTAGAESSWKAVPLPSRPLNISADGDTFWVCGADELISSSSDGGATWHSAHYKADGALLLSIGFASERFGYAAGTGASIFITDDGGKTWSTVKSPSSVIYELSFADDKTAIAHGAGGVFTTSDGGASWSPVKIETGDDDYKRMNWVSTVVALDSKRMAIVLAEGNSYANHQILYLTEDGGTTWKVNDIPSTGIWSFARHGAEYWIAGYEVIEKDKPGGGYGVSLVMHSAAGEKWTHVDRWSKKEFSECNDMGCLYGDGAGFLLPVESAPTFFTFPAEKVVTDKWAVAQNSICTVGGELKCASASPTSTMPPQAEHLAQIPSRIFAPPLNAPSNGGIQCILCDVERVMVTKDFQGVVEVDLKLSIGMNGLVQKVEITKAAQSEIGDRVAAAARGWIFVPYQVDGVVHPTSTNVRLKVQALKSN